MTEPRQVTRSKFTCVSKTTTGSEGNLVNSFIFMPVVGGSEENKSFWKWTPSGKLELACLNPSVDFDLGKDYYIDIHLAK